MLAMTPVRYVALVVLVVALVVGSLSVGRGVAQEATPEARGPVIPPELTEYAGDWPARQGNLAGHRANLQSAITAENVAELEVAWSFPIEAPGVVGGMTAGPIIAGETIYIQDMQSNVFALDRATGQVRWEARYDVPTIGPNGVGIGYGMVYAPLGDTAEIVALSAETGDEVWRVKLSANPAEGISLAPIAYDNVVYVSTVPGNSGTFYTGGAKGIVYALDVQTGAVLWQFDTTTDNLWGNPRINSGGGVWYPFSFDDDGNVYFGTGNAGPWPGTTEYPNASSRPGSNDYANSMVSLDTATGQIRWHYNANPHDLFDHDSQLTPIITTVTIDGGERMLAIGGGKKGKVVAADAATGEILWEVEVGQHNGNAELEEIPEGETLDILPGGFGGIETSAAYAGGVLFVPVVNLAARFSSTEFVGYNAGLDSATSELVALNVADGSVKWTVEMPTMNVGSATVANDVVFTSGLDGVFRGYHAETGELLWSYQARSGFNAPAAVAGDLVIVPAAGPLIPPPPTEGATPVAIEPAQELIAFRLPDS
ncbi:MAG: PQQ-binding-like beta-propeller repeat protein [Thermomicrobiales bacterium]